MGSIYNCNPSSASSCQNRFSSCTTCLSCCFACHVSCPCRRSASGHDCIIACFRCGTWFHSTCNASFLTCCFASRQSYVCRQPASCNDSLICFFACGMSCVCRHPPAAKTAFLHASAATLASIPAATPCREADLPVIVAASAPECPQQTSALWTVVATSPTIFPAAVAP